MPLQCIKLFHLMVVWIFFQVMAPLFLTLGSLPLLNFRRVWIIAAASESDSTDEVLRWFISLIWIWVTFN